MEIFLEGLMEWCYFLTQNIKFRTCILILYRLSVPIFLIISFDSDSILDIVTGIVFIAYLCFFEVLNDCTKIKISLH